jgi:hypothetical protein
MRISEAIGRGIGGLLAPLAAEGSLIRGARLFHPDGVVYCAEVRPLANAGALGYLGEALVGKALVRLSGATRRWRSGKDRQDLLGVAIRFKGSAEITAAPAPSDQDLLFASFRSIWSLPLAMFTTYARDFLANTYYAALPFRIHGVGRVKLRLVTAGLTTTGKDRRERLAQAVSLGVAVFHLEVRKTTRGAQWVPVAAIDLRERADINQEELGFTPFRSGRGIHPVGLLQSIRVAVYPASQLGRRVARGLR